MGVLHNPMRERLTEIPEVKETKAQVLYRSHVNPQWARLLDLLGMNVTYTRCQGVELFTSDGRRFLDFLSGYCVHNAGHNHPDIVAAVREELKRSGPAMLQSHVPDLAGELASRLCERAGGRLNKVFFSNSGSEGIEAAIKFSRAHTGRSALLCAQGAFHGLTCGALSLMGNTSWQNGFGPFLPDIDQVRFGSIEDLKNRLSTERYAAFIVEPVQGEGGVRVPAADYLPIAQSLCRKHGTLFVLDEVQTGLYRTGPFLASHHFGLDPDMVVLAKALSGGLIPSGAVLMSDDVYSSVYGSLQRAIIHTSTFSENGLALCAGLATLKVLERERFGDRAASLGMHLRQRLEQELSGYELFDETRGLGLLCAIAFRAPRKLSLRIPFEAFQRVHPAMFGQVLVMRMFQDGRILTQVCGNDLMVLKIAPPLVVSEDQVAEFVVAVKHVVERMHSSSAFWSEALGLARRVINI
jgi:ornithine--oxo-acid transaminase